MPEFAFEFWNRVDEKRGDMLIRELCENAGVSYKTITNQRASQRYPKAEDVDKIAKVLNTSFDYLMTGKEQGITPSFVATNDDLAFEFWKRVDESRRNMTLMDMAQRAGISYATVKDMRTRCRLPKQPMIQQIAEVLNTTPDMLLSGKERAREGASLSPEALAVENDDRLKALVRACMRDDRLLDIISAVVESSEKTLSKKA